MGGAQGVHRARPRSGRVEFVLDQGDAIAGQVRDREGKPIANATVTPTRRQQYEGDLLRYTTTAVRDGVRADEEGRFRLDGLQEGRYIIEVKAAGFKDRELEPIPAGSENVVVTLERARERPSCLPADGSSMLKQELGVVQQGPEQVLGGQPAVRGVFREFGYGQIALCRAGMARQRGQEELIDDRGVIHARFQKLSDAVVSGDDLGVEGRAAHDLQRLLKGGVGARSHSQASARRLAEVLQERVDELAVRHLGCP